MTPKCVTVTPHFKENSRSLKKKKKVKKRKEREKKKRKKKEARLPTARRLGLTQLFFGEREDTKNEERVKWCCGARETERDCSLYIGATGRKGSKGSNKENKNEYRKDCCCCCCCCY